MIVAKLPLCSVINNGSQTGCLASLPSLESGKGRATAPTGGHHHAAPCSPSPLVRTAVKHHVFQAWGWWCATSFFLVRKIYRTNER